MSIHSRNDDIILQFGLKKPAYRIVVNSPTTHGSIGLTTGLDPAMTLGCGGYGGNITSDNISPRHLLNIKRLAYEITPAVVRNEPAGAADRGPQLPKARVVEAPAGLAAEPLARRIDQFLASRGYSAPAGTASPAMPAAAPAPPPTPGSPPPPSPSAATSSKPVDFVCEDDVRQAVKQGRKIVIGERSIVTPAARDLGEEHHVFTQAAWPR